MIQFPDVSHYQAGLSLTGAMACIAKATEGASFKDASYGDFHRQASTLHIPFAAYHYINADAIGAQAANAFYVVQRDVPLMIDAEATGASVDRVVSFVDSYRTLGGLVTLVYYPHWWWVQSGSPSLKPFVVKGLALVSSNYSGTGGWDPYGGMTPSIWQYTDSHPFNGYSVDFNAYPGNINQLQNLFNGGATVVVPKFVRVRTTGAVWLTNGPCRYHIPDQGSYTAALAMWGQTTADVLDIDEVQLPAYGQDMGASAPTHGTWTIG